MRDMNLSKKGMLAIIWTNVSCTVKGDEKKNMPIFIPNIQGKWCIKRKDRSTKNVTMKGKKAIQKVKSKKEGKINTNHRQSSVMTLLRDKKKL